MKRNLICAAFGVSVALSASVASAHVTLETPDAPAGDTYKAVLRIGHGCDGQPTKTLRVQIPDGFYNAKPMPKAGWELTTTTGDYARPFNNHGVEMTSGVREIVWSGGELPDDWYDEFTLRGTVGPDVVAGSTIYFPTVQECDGAKEAWLDVTGAAGVAYPAPALMITEATTGGHGHHMAGHSADAAVLSGDVAVSGLFSRATPPAATVGGGYMVLKNDGAQDDRLVGATSPLADRVEIHEMSMQGDVMKMRALPDGVALPAGQTVDLKPGGTHLMLMGLKQPLVQGDSVPVTLTFEHAAEMQVTLPVGAMNAKGDAHAGH